MPALGSAYRLPELREAVHAPQGAPGGPPWAPRKKKTRPGDSWTKNGREIPGLFPFFSRGRPVRRGPGPGRKGALAESLRKAEFGPYFCERFFIFLHNSLFFKRKVSYFGKF